MPSSSSIQKYGKYCRECKKYNRTPVPYYAFKIMYNQYWSVSETVRETKRLITHRYNVKGTTRN